MRYEDEKLLPPPNSQVIVYIVYLLLYRHQRTPLSELKIAAIRLVGEMRIQFDPEIPRLKFREIS